MSHSAAARLSGVPRRDILGAVANRTSACVVNLQVGNSIVPVLHPHKLLEISARDSEWFGKLLSSSLEKHQPSCSPWRLVVYHDEVACGNVLKADNQRKATAFYFSFLEFEMSLRDEDSWLCLAVVPKKLMDTCEGGISSVFKEIVRLLVHGDSSFSSGVIVHFDAMQPTLLVARLVSFIADEAALKASMCAKGSAGCKPCLQCKNIMAKGTLAQSDHTHYLKNISCADPADFDLASDTDIWELADNLSSFVGTKKALCELERASGLNSVESGILRCHAALVL